MVTEPLEKEVEDEEEGSRKMDQDILILSRIVRMLERMPESSRKATMLYLRARYGVE